MSQNLTVYSAPNAVSVIETMGRAIAKSQFIKCDNPEQGIVLAMTCYSKGMDFLSLAQKYDLIGGRLSMKSDAMLSGFRERGGKHKIIQRTGDGACVLLVYDGQEYESRMSWEDARKEPFVYNGKESEILRMIAADNQKLLAQKLKPKYATPRARMQMLWARVVSDGVRALCPEVNTGTYTPEEIADFEECSSASLPVADGVSEVAPQSPVSVADDATDAEDAEFVPIPVVDIAKTAQVTQMLDLFDSLGIDAAGRDRAYASVGATEMATVTQAGAETLVAKMQERLNAVAPSPPPVSESARVADDGSPATSEQVAIIKSLIEHVAQKEGMAGVPGRIKEHINKHGIAKITHLSALSAHALIDSLNGTGGIEDFFDVPPMSATPL